MKIKLEVIRSKEKIKATVTKNDHWVEPKDEYRKEFFFNVYLFKQGNKIFCLN